MSGRSPHHRLPAYYEGLREKFMNQNGIHHVYPLGRDYAITYPSYFPAYQDFLVRWFGYIVDISSFVEIGMFSGGGYALLKFENNNVVGVVKNNKGYTSYPKGGTKYYNTDYFSFAVRTRYDRGLDKDILQPMENEYALDNTVLSFTWVQVREYLTYPGTYMFMSTHFGDDTGVHFPAASGLDPVVAGVVVMEPGSYAVYTGIYTGPDVIRINAPGAVSDLGTPGISGIYVKIGVRKNLKMFVFHSDYGRAPVLAPFGELMNTGHDYVPRFSLNFNVRHVLISGRKRLVTRSTPNTLTSKMWTMVSVDSHSKRPLFRIPALATTDHSSGATKF